ncbi:MAG: penicillin acylase family protein [Janibacter sp.]
MSWQVRRDQWGVPHCWGATLEDLAHAQGWSAAVDRAWQLETERRRSTATAAAVLGSSDWDDFASATGLPDMARAAVAGLDEETEAWLGAFVDGVNAGMDEGASRAPEFAATGVSPDVWRPESAAGVFLVQHVLMGSFGHQLWRRHVRAVLGEEGMDLLSHEGVPLGGSNAWALTGSRTTHGRPMIAADPHRVLEAPGIYQQVRLSTPTIDVSGLAFPGVPGVAHFGQTGSVAWAVTHAMADYQQVSDGDGAMPYPITPAGVDGDIGLGAMRRLLLARTVDDVDEALDAWVEPVNSLVIAGADGRVRERVAGRMVTKEGTTTAVPPARRDLAEGEVVVHANDRRESVADLGEEFAPPHRGVRIRQRLEEREQWDREGLMALQMDTWLGSWPTFRSVLHQVDPGRGGAQVRRRLLGWDGHMDEGSTAAALFARWRTELVRLVAAHPRLEALHTPTGLPPLFAPWTDPVARIGACIERIVARGEQHGLPIPELVATALDRVAGTPDDRTWGKGHFAPFVRVVVGDDGPAPRPLGGDGDCVLATSAVPGLSDQCWRGPAARLVWDLGGASSWVVPLGADGSPDSPHTLDQHDLWRSGAQVPTHPSGGGFEASAAGGLRTSTTVDSQEMS